MDLLTTGNQALPFGGQVDVGMQFVLATIRISTSASSRAMPMATATPRIAAP